VGDAFRPAHLLTFAERSGLSGDGCEAIALEADDDGVTFAGVLMDGRVLRYPVNENALKYGAGVETETSSPADAYARFAELKPVACPDEFPGD